MNALKLDYMKFYRLTLGFLFLGVIGCAGSAKQTPPEQLIGLVQTHAEASKRKEQFLSQLAKVTLADYRDYQVGPEDLLEVSFFGQDELSREARVNGRGEITLPLAGPVKVAGLSPPAVEQRLAEFYKKGKFLRDPQITVLVKEYRHQRVMVTGAVVNPGSYEVIGPRTLLEMLGKAGGMNEKAGDRVHVIQNQSAADRTKALKGQAAKPFTPGTETIVIDLRRLLNDGDLALNVPIKNGDVINVPPARSAFVLGAVKKPGQVPVKANLTVTQAVALAQGLDITLASNNVSILRFDEQGQRLLIPVNLKEVTTGQAPDPLLKENDIVFVQESGIIRVLFDIKNFLPGSLGVGATLF